MSSRITARALRALLAPPAPPAVLAEAERERAPLKSTPTLTAPPLTTRSPVSRTTSPRHATMLVFTLPACKLNTLGLLSLGLVRTLHMHLASIFLSVQQLANIFEKCLWLASLSCESHPLHLALHRGPMSQECLIVRSPESEAVRTAAERRSASGDFFAAPTAGGPPPAAAAAPAPPPKTLSAALPAAVGLPGSRQASAPGNASPPSPGSAAPAAATVVAPVAQVPKVLRPVRGEDRYIVASRNGSGAPAVVPYPGNGKVAGNGKVQL